MRFCYLLIFLVFVSEANAQDSTVIYNASVTLSGSIEKTPFWISANKNGAVPNTGNFGLGQFSIYKIYNLNDPRRFQWSAGAEVVASYSEKPQVFVSDLFGAIKVGKVEILAGQKAHMTGLVDTLLTSGSLSVSGNTRPFPRLQISVPDYYPLYFTNDFVSVKASYSDGLLHGTDIGYGSVRSISQTFFHQKSIYFRLGREEGNWTGLLGMNHQAIWGGEEEINPVEKMSKGKAYRYTVTGKTLNSRKIGNHFGTIDLGVQWKRTAWTYFLYRQNIYETGSLFKVINFTDGLTGLSIKRNKKIKERYFLVNSILVEVIGTKEQTNKNPFSGLAIFEKGNYYNHFTYANGYSYFGRAIGTPLIANKYNTRSDDGLNASEFTNNNRFWTLHSGVTASWLNTNFLFKGTYSRNFGTYISPFDGRKDQVSFIITAERKLKGRSGLIAFAGLAGDIGSLYPHSESLFAGLKKTGFLN
ncbi:hypothetical protein E0F88_32490 [Dyadobacter psychrotolerans]|uniref:Capsule assembly Wzi family protein n=2 Tax=Dyadobacter psychrotolerans TaxID=2541721 RepID=A0A4R5D7D8_9BACT|nr:hypothetical protein E0F88_32490 [Dyadobacter psychrotolerans]